VSSHKLRWFTLLGAVCAVGLAAFGKWLAYLQVHLVDAGPGSLARGIPFALEWLWRFFLLDIIFMMGIMFWLLITRRSNGK